MYVGTLTAVFFAKNIVVNLFLQVQGVETEQVEGMDESCEGIGEEECMNRRTLVAHLDYIYTQKQKP